MLKIKGHKIFDELLNYDEARAWTKYYQDKKIPYQLKIKINK